MKRLLSGLILLCLLLTLLPVQSLASAAAPQTDTADTAQATTSNKLIAITFDDGPGQYTARLLDGLKARGVKVTFFMQGCNAERYPNTVQRVYDEGHEVASHTYNHPTLSTQSVSQIRWQLDTTAAILDKACGAGTKYNLRPPYGNYSQTVLDTIGCPAVIWTVDPMDWRDRNADTVCSRIVSNAFDGAIVLVHDIHSTSVDGALMAIDKLKAQGYEFVTVSELYRRRGVVMLDGELHYSCKPKGETLAAISTPTIRTTPVLGGYRVTIEADSGAQIYYSVDGSEPARSKQRYTESFVVTKNCTVKALAAYKLNGDRSETVSLQITLPTPEIPEIRLQDGLLYFTGVTSGNVYYTTDSTVPTANSATYQAPIPYFEGVIRYRAMGPGYIGSTYTMYLTGRGNLFRDVPQSAWFYAYCDRAFALGLFSGTGNFCFSPTMEVTRRMFVTLLYRLSGEQYSERADFTDVDDEMYYARAVAWAAARGVTAGVSEDCFAPDDTITREQMCVMLQAFLNYCELEPERVTEPDFVDSEQISDWAFAAVDAIAGYGFMCGTGGNCFRPEGTATRAEAAVVLLYVYDLLAA